MWIKQYTPKASIRIIHSFGMFVYWEFVALLDGITYILIILLYYFSLFNREKRNLPFTPILASVNRLVCYHLGTVAKGSFIITLVKIPRMILMYIHTQLKGKVREIVSIFLLKLKT